MKSNKETYMNSNYLYPGSDLEGDARESEKLQIAERMPQPRRLAAANERRGNLPALKCSRWSPDEWAADAAIRHCAEGSRRSEPTAIKSESGA